MRARYVEDHGKEKDTFGNTVSKKTGKQGKNSTSAGIMYVCSSCKEDVPPKPGFRPSMLRCPKCGKSVVKK